jgi:glucose/arabinose dehydrogenase
MKNQGRRQNFFGSSFKRGGLLFLTTLIFFWPATSVSAATPVVDPSLSGASQVQAAPLVAQTTSSQVQAASTCTHGFLNDACTSSAVAGGVSPAVVGTLTLAAGFSDSVVFAGLTNPTSIRFAADGSVWVLQKAGQILRYSSINATTHTVWADLSAEVNSYWDRGLMGLALAPNFPTDPSVYVLYTYDHNPVHDYLSSAPAVWNDACPSNPGALTDGCPTLGRLSKLTANAAGTTWTGTETVMLQGWCQQGPSHSMDNLGFGPDGYLYVTAGEGDMFNVADYGQMGGSQSPIVTPANPCGDPPSPAGTALTAPTAEGGMLRSQSALRPGGPVVLNGTMLRINPNTVAGAPGNPFATSSDATAQKILAYGLRNPFRFTFRPGFPNQVWIGDVGNSTWESIDQVPIPTSGGSLSATANNFGWPCYEGGHTGITYGNTVITQCTNLINSGIVNQPYYTYNHAANIATGEACRTGSSSISALSFYSGTAYPAAYQGALFFGDHSRDCIWAMLPDASGNPNPANIVPVVTGSPTASTYWTGVVDLESGPGGNLYYVNLDNGTINRLTYGLPSALIKSDVTTGNVPLVVHFDGSASSDPIGLGLSYAWTVPGGVCDSLTIAKPTCTFSTAGGWNVTLKVTDANSNQNTGVAYKITSGDTPPLVVIDTINGATPPTQPGLPSPPPAIRPAGVPAFWNVGDNISFTGHATSTLDGTEPAANLSWQLIMHHCPSDCHLHFLQTWTGAASGSFSAPDHPYPSYLEVMLTATDSLGVSSSTSIYLYPKTATININSVPAGLSLTVGGNPVTTPGQATFMNGGAVSLAALASVTIGGQSYNFTSWSDGGALSHTVTAVDGASYTANYQAVVVKVQNATYHPLTPIRLVDSRLNYGLTKLQDHVPQTFAVTGHVGVPANAVAVTGNVATCDSTGGGYFALTTTPTSTPSTSTINFPAGDIRANNVTMALGPGGTISVVFNSWGGASSDIVFDVTGYFTNDATGDTYHPLTPIRLADSRFNYGLTRLQNRAPQILAVTGHVGVPANAVAVTGNVVSVSSTYGGYFALTTAPTSTPVTSTVNFPTGDIRANGVTMALGAGGTIAVTYASIPGSSSDIVFDVTGYFTADATGDGYKLMSPTRLLDSRFGQGITILGDHAPRTFAVAGQVGVPANAVAITGNLVAVIPSGGGYFALTTAPTSTPSTSTINFPAGDIRANGVTVALGASGTLSVVYNSWGGASSQIVFDVTGYFVP